MKTIHALTVVDKSTSMLPHRERTIEGINANINALKSEVDSDTKILNTQLQFSATGNSYYEQTKSTIEANFVFKRIGEPVEKLSDLTKDDYLPDGGTPLLDAIGYGIEKIKEFHKDDLGSDDLKIIVTIFTDGEENSSRKWTWDQIKKMTEHLQSDGKFTFTFIGCGSFEDVSHTSAALGVSSLNTVAYAATAAGTTDAYMKVATSYSNFARATKSGLIDNDLFTEKLLSKKSIVKAVHSK